MFIHESCKMYYKVQYLYRSYYYLVPTKFSGKNVFSKQTYSLKHYQSCFQHRFKGFYKTNCDIKFYSISKITPYIQFLDLGWMVLVLSTVACSGQPSRCS